ncbi:hypothetical protein L486_06110 [Kwoniella mangroviensis CBS 10435]|uniref:WSC domain-containing protein n=1 Tax=Kwoniella mangroviensis CBS 10435 TaxID=1331196 RepID=A0A1B9IKI5_9TREE|nr:hypothetical protein L486_06110 [Kwoniella mangroviensis CBS 10435]
MLYTSALLPVLAYLSLVEASPIDRRAAVQSTTTRASNDLQTYNLGLGAIYAPAVTKSGNYWYSSGQQYNFLTEALSGSCYKQMDQCQLKANQQGNTPFAVSDCNGWQIQACLNSGSGSNSSTSTAASSSSKASSSSSSSSAKASSAAASSSSSTKASTTASSSSVASSSTSTVKTSSSTSSSAAASSTSSSVAKTSTSASATTSSAAPTTAPSATAGNYQTYTGAAGGIAAPAVTKSGDKFVQSGTTYDDIAYALQQSCYAQASACSSSSASFDKNVCWGTQVNECLSTASSAASSYSASAAAYSSSVASANFAAATMARTVSGDLQTFTGALGGIPAPAVTGMEHNWKVDGRSDVFWNLIDALSTSCYIQQDKAGAAGAASNWAYEMSTNNIYNVQTPNCLSNAQNVAANWSPTSTSVVATSTTASSTSTSKASSAAPSSSSAMVSSSASTSAASSSVVSSSSSASKAVSSSAAASSVAISSASPASSSTSVVASSAAPSSSGPASSAVSSSASAVVVPTVTVPSITEIVIPSTSSSASVSASATPIITSVATPVGWSAASTSCIAEGSRGRALTGPTLASSDMTWQKCATFCDGQGYSIFGIEYSQECYCGATLSNGASLTLPSTNCNMKCGGNNAICGGPSALTLFVKDSALLAGLSSDLQSVKVTLPEGWVAASSVCVQEGTTGRALAGASYYDDNMTIGKCLAYCKTQGMQWAGIEYSRECYCGNDLVNGASLDRIGTCDMSCPGQLGTTCGGPSLLSLFKDSSLLYSLTTIGNWEKQGCIQEVSGRALNAASLVTDDMTLEKCTSFCSASGFTFAGLEYGSECYCGNSLANGATLDAFSTQCNMACSGNKGEICGGPNGITLYSTVKNALVGA